MGERGPAGERGPQGERGPAGPPGPGGGSGAAPQFAMLYQEDILSVPFGGGTVPFTPAVQSLGLSLRDGVLHILQPGVYYIQYFVHFPVAARLTTALSLRLGERDLPGSSCYVDKENPGQPFTAAGQAVVHLEEPGELTLYSARAFSLSGAVPGDTLASLAVMRL